MKVDFMIIGAMKCGTTSQSALLALHPEIGFTKPKETNFFFCEYKLEEAVTNP